MLPLHFYTQAIDGPAEGFRLYDQASGELGAELGADDRSFDLAALELEPGQHVLELSAVNAWGGESERATLAVTINEDGAAVELTPATNLRTWPLAGSHVAVSWIAASGATDQDYQRPATYEIGRLEGSSVALLDEVAAGRVRQFEASVGPFADGETVRLAVRPSDGEPDGLRGPWVKAPASVAYAQPPETPEAVEL